MKLNTEFAHVPEKNISLGITVNAVKGTVYLVSAVVNTDKGDRFNRARAREIIRGRTRKLVENGNPATGSWYCATTNGSRDSYSISKAFKQKIYADGSKVLEGSPSSIFEKCISTLIKTIEELGACAA